MSRPARHSIKNIVYHRIIENQRIRSQTEWRSGKIRSKGRGGVVFLVDQAIPIRESTLPQQAFAQIL